MKKLQLLFLLLLPIWLAGQTDAARQIDSLVDLSKTLMNQGKSRFTDA
ncbi:MAG: hypothetical protein IT261_04480, partial [Saprospiraceae bacterium]|nr:hypothetical protein [Saprospiraceae bacterium]